LARARRGILRARQGRLAEALDDLLTTGSWCGALGVVNPAYLPWRSEAAMVLARLGRIEEARSLVHEEVALARAWGAPRTLGRALCSAGLVVGGDEGVALLRDAVDVLSTSEAMLVRAEATTELGAALRRENHPSEPRELLSTGLELAERCGARRPDPARTHRADRDRLPPPPARVRPRGVLE